MNTLTSKGTVLLGNGKEGMVREGIHTLVHSGPICVALYVASLRVETKYIEAVEASNSIVPTVPDKASNSSRQDTDGTKIAVGRLTLQYKDWKNKDTLFTSIRRLILYSQVRRYIYILHNVPYYAISYFGALLNRRGVDLLAVDLIAFIDGVYLYVQHHSPVHTVYFLVQSSCCEPQYSLRSTPSTFSISL